MSYEEYRIKYCMGCQDWWTCDLVPIKEDGTIIEDFENAEKCRDYIPEYKPRSK